MTSAAVPTARPPMAVRLATLPRSARVAVVGASAAAVAAVGIGAHLIDPETSGLGITCPFRAVTGLYCPGCGVTRAVHRLATGDVVGAMAFNPLAVLVLLGVGLWAVSLALVLLDLRRVPFRAPPSALQLLPVVVIGFWVARNIPIAPFTALAP